MVTKETIEKKVKEHGEKLKQINEQARTLRAQNVRIQQNLVQLADESKVIQGAVMELQDLLKELTKEEDHDDNDSPAEDDKVLPPVDNVKSDGDAQSGG